jgi:hypothetical protein
MSIDLFVLNSFIIFYFLQLLLIKRNGAISGPFTSKRIRIYIPGGWESYWHPGLLDYFRMLFGAYDRGAEEKVELGEKSPEIVWKISDRKLFKCPYCLGFWLSLIVTGIEYQMNVPIDNLFICVFGAVGGAAFLCDFLED